MLLFIPFLGNAEIEQPDVISAVAAFPIGLRPFSANEDDRPELINYGEFLFSSRILSRDKSLACDSCHVLHAGLAGVTPLAVGINGQVGQRRVPPIFNLYAADALMVDGRAPGLNSQPSIPLEAHDEMDIDWGKSLSDLAPQKATSVYLAASRTHAITRSMVLAALSAYVRTLVSGGSDFDRYYYRGDDSAISEPAKEGFRIFTRKARCASCHLVTGTAAPFTDYNFHSIGVGFANSAYSDPGRFDVTGNPIDQGAFKTPTLRDVAQRRYFMHDGSISSLRGVIDYYNRGGNRDATNLDGRIKPLYLTEIDIQDLLAFLQSLNSNVVSYRRGQP